MSLSDDKNFVPSLFKKNSILFLMPQDIFFKQKNCDQNNRNLVPNLLKNPFKTDIEAVKFQWLYIFHPIININSTV